MSPRYTVLRHTSRLAGDVPARRHVGFQLEPVQQGDDHVLPGLLHEFIVRGDEELGALARIHERLAGASVEIYASSGVADGVGSFAYVIYVRRDQFQQVLDALEI